MEAQNTDKTNSLESSTLSMPAALPEVLLKKQCEHAKCPHYKCERKDLRIGGIDI